MTTSFANGMRSDHTRWLIHFVRDRVPEQDIITVHDEEGWSWAGGEIEPDAPAFPVLKTIVRLGGLIAGNSVRNGRTTLYGGRPVVCATEMPIYSFAQYARARANSAKVSAYGITLLKTEFFAAGGRPVIYGLSSDQATYLRNDPYCRILDPDILPMVEQYRYVAYSPSSTRWIDWTHEREWRWVARSDDEPFVWARREDGTSGPAPGLPLFSGKGEGGHFSQIGIIVWNKAEAEEIQSLLTGLYFARSNEYDAPFDRDVIEKSFIITLEDVVRAVESDGTLNGQTIEGIDAAHLLTPVSLQPPPLNAENLIHNAVRTAVQAGQLAANDYASRRSPHEGACGYAVAATYEITHGLVQHMLSTGIAYGPFDGKVRIRVPEIWPPSQSIDYNEYVYEAVVDVLSAKLGVRVYMDSWLD